MTDLAQKRHREWEEFTRGLSVVVEELEPGKFTYYYKHPVHGEDRLERGWFTSKEAAEASAAKVIALKWPEPKV